MFKIGFACKYMHYDRSLSNKDLKDIEQSFNGTTTTIKYLDSLSLFDAYNKLEHIVFFNLKSLHNLILYVSQLDEHLKMLRISSDLLPFYTHSKYSSFYKSNNIKQSIETELSKIGDLIRYNNIKCSMHPGQFCVLASDKPDVIVNSIKEFEYHVDVIRMLGFSKTFQDFKCNIHISGKLGVDGMRQSIYRLSNEALRVITIENDEKVYGLNECLKLSDICPIVFDIHHHWIKDNELFNLSDIRYSKIINSWKGKRPTMHYSQSKEDLNISDYNNLPNINQILNKYNKKDLYAHSNMMWNKKLNEYLFSFLSDFDIMIEAKYKNLAAQDFFNQYNKYNNI